jgi:hypothetical protein
MLATSTPKFFNCVQITQYDVKGGHNACTAIALATIRACLLKQKKTKNKFQIEEVDFVQAIEVGSFSWGIWWEKCGKKQNKSFIFVKELYDIPEAKELRKRLDLVEEYYGKLRGGSFEQFPNFDTLESSIKILDILGDNHYAVVTIRYKSFCLIKRDKKIWLFDSHGSPNNPKHSTLCSFDSADSVCLYIRAMFPERILRALYNTKNQSILSELESDDNSFFVTIFKTKETFLLDCLK